jgi:hypothetical protein
MVAGGMPVRRFVSASRAVLAGAVLAATVQGCGAAPPAPRVPAAEGACVAEGLAACEARLADDGAGRELIAAYAAARAARDPADAWAALWRALAETPPDAKPRALVLVEGGAAVDRAVTSKAARVIETAGLPAPGALAAEELLLVMARAAGFDHVIRARAAELTQLFPRDPLAPFQAGLRPVVRDDGSLAHLEADVTLARLVRAAFDAASALRYVEAARAADALSAALAGRDPAAPAALRGRYALQLLGAAGLALDAEEGSAPAAPAVPAAPAASAPSTADTPYTRYLRVLTARDPRKAWEPHAALVLPGIAADRRDAVTSLFARSRDCEALHAPPMDGPRDLVFATRLAGALSRDARPPAGQLPLTEWLARYATLLQLVEQTGSAWSYLPALLYQRGDATGLGPSSTATYRRVTELGLAHLAATRALQEAYPSRYRAFTQLALATAPGLLGDEKLRQALVKLTESSVQDKLAAAKDADAVLAGVATGALAGLSYPPALQEPHFTALLGAVTAKLHGDLRDQTGWGLAALHAADAVYRLATDRGARPRASADQISRALAGPGVERPALASLATATARYAALAAVHALDATVSNPDHFTPERRAARDGLRAAVAGLGAPGEAPASVLDDTTELADGLVALVSTSLAGVKQAARSTAARASKAPAPATCAPQPVVPLDATTRRALARLGDVRRRILAHPRYREGDGLWVRRVRLLVTVLSDAMDVAIAGDTRKPLAFVVPAGDAEKALAGALGEVLPGPLAAALAGGYALGRQLAEAPSAEAFLKAHGPALRRLASGLGLLFRADAPGADGPAMGAALLDALAGVGLPGKSGEDFMGALIAQAGAFHEKQRVDEGDLCLLAALVLASLTHQTLPSEAAEVAARHGSRMAWVMAFNREIHRDVPGQPPDPARYAEGMRRATDDACQAPDADATLAVMAAVRDFSGGKRRAAREALDAVLTRADARGLGVPRMSYRYEEKTATRVFAVNVDVSYGSGVLLAGNTFQLALGLRSGGEPGGSLTASLSPADSSAAGEDAARYYVYTAALATVYHLVEGDAERGVAAGERAVAALTGGLALGSRTLRSERPAAWGTDAREVLILAAQLAADAGLPFLAGDLWTVVRQGFTDALDDRAVATMLDRPLLGLAGIRELEPVTARARRSLKVLADPLPCTEARVEVGGYEEVTCEAYPAAVSLRIADALKKLPRLRRGAEAARCAPLRSLDAFLASADRGTYDPDAFTRAVEGLRADGKGYDAAVLLTRHKQPNHCNPALVAAARALGRSPQHGPALRADLLSSAVNCTALAGGPEVEADVLALDEETRRLPDPSRSLKLIVSIADLAARTDRWDVLGKLVDRPDFVSRWMGVHPNAAAAALVLDHAVRALRGDPVSVEATQGTYRLLCETFPSAERAEMCATAAALRAPLLGPAGDRQALAKEAVRKLVISVAAGPPGKRP